MLSAITTAGFILDGVCTEIRGYLISILEGEREDDSFFGYIYTLDEGDDPLLEKNWIKANPGLGSSKMLSYMRDMARKARALPSALANFKTKDLNIWCNSAEGWIDIQVWDLGKKKFCKELLAGRKCFGGLDLGSTRDLTAFALVFPPLEKAGQWYVLVKTWCPRARVIAQADDAAPYSRWEQQGWLTVTEGDVADYKPVRQAIREAVKTYDLEMLGFDKWNAQEVSNDMIDEGVPMVEIPQMTGGMYPGSKLLEMIVYSKRLRHNGNPVLRWAAGNVSLLYDSNGNFRPDKKKSKLKGRIDPLVATVIAMSTFAIGHTNTDISAFIEEPIIG